MHAPSRYETSPDLERAKLSRSRRHRHRHLNKIVPPKKTNKQTKGLVIACCFFLIFVFFCLFFLVFSPSSPFLLTYCSFSLSHPHVYKQTPLLPIDRCIIRFFVLPSKIKHSLFPLPFPSSHQSSVTSHLCLCLCVCPYAYVCPYVYAYAYIPIPLSFFSPISKRKYGVGSMEDGVRCTENQSV